VGIQGLTRRIRITFLYPSEKKKIQAKYLGNYQDTASGTFSNPPKPMPVPVLLAKHQIMLEISTQKSDRL
jgi:hypothetical protein